MPLPSPHLFMTNGEIIVLIRQIFVGKVTSLFFNTLSRFVIAFLPRSKREQSLDLPMGETCVEDGFLVVKAQVL